VLADVARFAHEVATDARTAAGAGADGRSVLGAADGP
jgi:hypothetical protein